MSAVHEYEYGLFTITVRCSEDPAYAWYAVPDDLDYFYCMICEDDLSSLMPQGPFRGS